MNFSQTINKPNSHEEQQRERERGESCRNPLLENTYYTKSPLLLQQPDIYRSMYTAMPLHFNRQTYPQIYSRSTNVQTQHSNNKETHDEQHTTTKIQHTSGFSTEASQRQKKPQKEIPKRTSKCLLFASRLILKILIQSFVGVFFLSFIDNKARCYIWKKKKKLPMFSGLWVVPFARVISGIETRGVEAVPAPFCAPLQSSIVNERLTDWLTAFHRTKQKCMFRCFIVEGNGYSRRRRRHTY